MCSPGLDFSCFIQCVLTRTGRSVMAGRMRQGPLNSHPRDGSNSPASLSNSLTCARSDIFGSLGSRVRAEMKSAFSGWL